jgi:predicted component of type VI protein secretion system
MPVVGRVHLVEIASVRHNVPVLIPLEENAPSRACILLDLPAAIGRSWKAEIRVDGPQVEEQHCLVYLQSGRLAVKDLQSRSGTYVNGERIVQRTLQVGDKLRIAGFTFRVSCLGSRTPQATSQASADEPYTPAGGHECLEIEMTCAAV